MPMTGPDCAKQDAHSLVDPDAVKPRSAHAATVHQSNPSAKILSSRSRPRIRRGAQIHRARIHQMSGAMRVMRGDLRTYDQEQALIRENAMRNIILCVALLAVNNANAADVGSAPGAIQPGDDQLSCEQIYAQGMAESQRDQQARSQKIEQMKKQNTATAALVTGAMLTGGMGGTGQAAQASAESMADRQMAMLGAPPPSNPRKDHLRQLWTEKHCVKK